MRKPWSLPFVAGIGAVALLSVMGWRLAHRPSPRAPQPSTGMADATRPPPAPAGPPWLYGRPDARFTVIEYADLECPYCRAYFPVLKGWIDAHPGIAWQWRHLPLSMHDPAATAEARLAECAGQTGGHAAFWTAVAWVYAHSRGNGRGLPSGASYPGLTPVLRRCLDSDRPDAVIRAQVAEAMKIGIEATPTLRLRDRQTGRTLVIPGPAEGDALLSAIDWLARDGEPPAASSATQMPADAVGDMPR